MDEKVNAQQEIKLYKRRWLILFLYVMYATSSAMQWVEYCIITNIVEKYYNVTSYAVDWTSLVTMVTYPPLLIPATYVIDKMVSLLLVMLYFLKTFEIIPVHRIFLTADLSSTSCLKNRQL